MNLRNGHHADSGLQPERTWLAWRRTLVSLVAASLLFLRWIPSHGRFALLLVGLALLAALMIGLCQQRRYRRGIEAINHGQAPAPLAEVLVLALTCAGMAALGVYGVVVFQTPP